MLSHLRLLTSKRQKPCSDDRILSTIILLPLAGNINEAMTDEAIQFHYGLDTIMATVTKGGVSMDYKLSNVPVSEKLEKFMEDVKYGGDRNRVAAG